MKTLIVLFAFLIGANAFGQNIPNKIENKSKQRADSKVDQSIDKGLDKAEAAIGNIFKKKDKTKKTADTPKTTDQTAPVTTEGSVGKQGTVQTGNGGFSDFIPGTKVIFEEHFEKDALGDFPAQWNTNGSGKIVTIEGVQGKWLDIVHGSVVNPVMNKALPENCTIEFDLFLQAIGERSIPIIQFGLTPVKDILKQDLYYLDKFYVTIARYNERDGKQIEYGLKDPVGSKNEFNLPSYTNKILHVSMAINKTRVRVYFDKEKLIDLPRALIPEMRNNFYFTNVQVVPASELGVLVTNLRIAAAETDARSLLIKQLMEEGKAVTNDILFDVNSDVIKPESYPIINQFGEVLKNNPSLKIKITGHTDSDGVPANNLSLSQKRSAAVKKYLISNFGITDARINTDGKGASEPVVPNTTSDGKAKNRRVEFTKL